MSGEKSSEFIAAKLKCKDTNINEETLLATDYLNHFNEVVMMIDMLPDMPDALDMVKEWEPKSYTDHFRDSTIADKELAVEVYDHVEPVRKEHFETTIMQIEAAIFQTIATAESALETGDKDFLAFQVGESAIEIHRLTDHLNAIIHGTADLSGSAMQPEAPTTMGQDDIDALFD